MNPIGRRILCVQQVYLQYWVIYILPTSGYQNQTNWDLRLWRFSALFKRAFSGSSRDTIASDCTSWTFADVLLPFQMQICVKSNNMQHIVGFTLTIRTVSFSLPANYIGRTIPATACSNMTLPWIRFAVWCACWRPRTRFVSPRSPPILEEWHCICTQQAVLKYIQKKHVVDTVLILHSEMNFTAMKLAPTSCSRTLSAISLCSIKSRQKLWIASVNGTKFERHGLANQTQW